MSCIHDSVIEFLGALNFPPEYNTFLWEMQRDVRGWKDADPRLSATQILEEINATQKRLLDTGYILVDSF